MALKLAKRVLSIKTSPIFSVTNKTLELKALGREIINLGVGEPDFATPENIANAAKAAISAGHTHYTAVGGVQELRLAIVNKLKRDNNLDYSVDAVIASTGAKQCIFNLLMATLDPEDEVLILAPYWASYPDMVLLTGAKPVFVEAGIENNFKVSAAQIAAAITAKTKLIMLNSPSNPAGTLYNAAELQDISALLLQHPNIMIMSDDIYEHIVWSEPGFLNILNVEPKLKERTIIINGVSKAYAMTGWRIGYAAGPIEIIKAMAKIQGQSTSNPSSISQYAALEALTGEQTIIATMVTEFKRRHDYIVAAMNTLPGIHCTDAAGAFYLMLDVRGAMQNLQVANDVELANIFLEKAGVALVPGSAFGLDGYLRLSFATSMQNLENAVAKLKEILD